MDNLKLTKEERKQIASLHQNSNWKAFVKLAKIRGHILGQQALKAEKIEEVYYLRGAKEVLDLLVARVDSLFAIDNKEMEKADKDHSK